MQEFQDVGRPIKVTYASKRPSPPSMNDVTADQVWYTKSDVWSYEQEGFQELFPKAAAFAFNACSLWC
jgi:hypothetical protein